MNAVAELVGLRQFEIVDRELPEPGAGEVQVEVAAVGICGSDMHSYAEGAVGDIRCNYPMVIGHEPSGTVLRTGAGVTGWHAGDTAALEPAIYCYHCDFCIAGRHNLCERIRFMSSGAEPGFFRQRVNLPAHNLIGLPREVGLREAALIEPIAIALHSMQFAPPRLGDHVAVIGAGPIGLLTIACLRLAGVRRIWCIEPLAYRRELAISMGADVAFHAGETNAAREIGVRGVDTVFDCAAKTDSLDVATSIVRGFGRIVLTGIHSETMVPINVQAMRRKEVALFSVRRSNHEGAGALDLLARYGNRFAPLITHTRPLSQINAAFALNEAYEDGVGKLLIVPD